MDWKQFIADIVRSLAWPAVVVTIVIVLRKQLETLAARQDESGASRGWKEKFEQKLNEARREAELLADGIAAPQAADSTLPVRPEAGQDSPLTTVLLAYNELLETLLRAKKPINMPADTPPQQILTALIQRRLLRERTLEFFASLTDARSAAVHTGDKDPITPGEATDFRRQAEILTALLSGAVNRL
jgi:hypothetical protein